MTATATVAMTATKTTAAPATTKRFAD
jgi:hypothetical protein